jgi:hypothetical protein
MEQEIAYVCLASGSIDSIRHNTPGKEIKKWRLYPIKSAKGWFTALHNGYIFLALNTKGAGIDTGYF